MTNTNDNKVVLYMKNVSEFYKLRDSVRANWYHSYGMDLSKGEIVLACLRCTLDLLNDKPQYIVSNNNDFKISYLYARVGQ